MHYTKTMRWDALLSDPDLPLHWAILQVLGVVLLVTVLCLWGLRIGARLSSAQAVAQGSREANGAAAREHVTRQVRSGVVMVGVTLTVRWLVPLVAAFQPSSPVLLVAMQVAMITSLAWFLLQLGRGLRGFLDARFDTSASDNLRSRTVRTQIAFIERIFDMIVVVVAAAASIGQFESGRQLSAGLLASAGVASLVIGFAAQRTLANLLAGFQIAFTSPIRIDDAVVVEDEWGWIEEISLTYVVVRVWDRRRLILPITYFVEKPFQNWTRQSGQIIGSVFLEVAHHTPFDALERELFRLLDENDLWDRDARVLQVVEMKERSLQLRALMTARNSPDCWDLRCAVRRGLVEFLAQHHPDCLPSIRLLMTSEQLAENSSPRAIGRSR